MSIEFGVAFDNPPEYSTSESLLAVTFDDAEHRDRSPGNALEGEALDRFIPPPNADRAQGAEILPPLQIEQGKDSNDTEGVRALARALVNSKPLINTELSIQRLNALFESLSDHKREQLKKAVQDIYGFSLEQHLRDRLSGANLEKALGLLHRHIDKSDDAGFTHRLLVELHQWYFGRSRSAIAKVLRDKFSTMTSKDIEEADRDYNKRFGLSLKSALEQDSRIAKPTKQALAIYFKGIDRRTDDDTLRLADIAIRAANLDMFGESMRGASQVARTRFNAENGDKRLKDAFGGHYYTLGIFGNFSDNELRHAREFAKEGKIGTARLILDNTSWTGSNKAAIDGALFSMTEHERGAYRAGKSIYETKGLSGTPDQLRQVNYYLELKASLEKAGNRTRVLRWEDLLETQGGTIVARLADHAGRLRMTTDSAGTVIGTIENMNMRDWERLKSDPSYEQKIRQMLETYLRKDEVDRCMEIVTKKKNAADFVEATVAGRRSITEAMDDNVHWYRNNREAMLSAIVRMTPGERDAYRNSSEFRKKVDKEVAENIGTSGLHARAARYALDRIALGEGVSENDLVVKLYVQSNRWFKDKAGAIRDIEQAFRTEPALRERIAHPATKGDAILSSAFKDALKQILKETYNKVAPGLLEFGSVSAEVRTSFDKGWIYNDKKGIFKDILAVTPEERQMLINQQPDESAKALQRKVLGPLAERQRELAVVALRQGHMEPEDMIRAFVLGLGTEKETLIKLLTEIPPSRREELIIQYAAKYRANCAGDLIAALPKPDRQKVEIIFSTGNMNSGEMLNSLLDHYSRSRDGIGRALINAIWDGTGFQLDQSMYDYIEAVSRAGLNVEELNAEREKKLVANVVESLARFTESKSRMAESLANTGISIAAIAGAVFTGGASLSLLAKAGIAGGIGATIKVGAKSIIEGADYQWSGRQIIHDTGTGFVFAAAAFVGPQEIARVLHIGSQAGTQAAAVATAGLAKLSHQAGVQVLKEGAEEAIKEGLTAMVRSAILTGTMEVPQKALVQLAATVATSGNEHAVRLALQLSLAAAIKEQSTYVMANLVTEFGLPAVSGLLAGGGSGAVNGATQWDSNKTPAENLRHIATHTAEGAIMGGISAFGTVLAMKIVGTVFRAGKDAVFSIFSKPVVDADKYLNGNIYEVGDFVEKPMQFQAHRANSQSVVVTKQGPVSARTGDWILTSNTGERRVVDSLTYTREYVPLPGTDAVQHKLVDVKAVRLTTDVMLKSVDGKQVPGRAGDWLVLSASGRQELVPNAAFIESYRPANALGSVLIKTATKSALEKMAPKFAAVADSLGDIKQFWIKPTEVEARFQASAAGREGHWIVTDAQGNLIDLSDEMFRLTFKAVEGKPNRFVSQVTVVEAARLEKPLTITGPAGKAENGAPGDWVISTPNGDQHILSSEQFKVRFEELAPGALPSWVQAGTAEERQRTIRRLFELAKEEMGKITSARSDVSRSSSAMRARNYYELALAAATSPTIRYAETEGFADIIRLARMTAQQGRLDEAVRLYDMIINPGTGTVGHISASRELIGLYEKTGKIGEAEALYRQTVAYLLSDRGKSDPLYLDTLDDFGHFLARHRMWEKAEEIYRRALAIRESSQQQLPRFNMSRSYNHLAALYEQRGMPAEAEKFYLQSLEHAKKTLPSEDGQTIAIMDSMVERYARLNRWKEAEAMALQAALLRSKPVMVPTVLHGATVAERVFAIAGIQLKQGKRTEAITTLQEAIYHQSSSSGAYSKELSIMLACLADQLKLEGAEPKFGNLTRLSELSARQESMVVQNLNRQAGFPTPEHDELLAGLNRIVQNHRKSPTKLVDQNYNQSPQ